jgi:2-methylcitrate dehydratase PrpD
MHTEDLAEFICQTKFADIPDGAIDAAKRHVLDFCGVAIAGSKEPAVKMVSEYVKNVGARCEAGVFGQGFRTETSLAALVNGTSAHVLDYDDYSMDTWTHPTATILPGILALGEKHGASGKEVFEAYIVGIEVASKIGEAVGSPQYEGGWHCTGTIGTICAAVGAARLLRLDRSKVKASLGIAASLAGGLRQNFGTMTKALHAGRAAQNGAFAATLAERGFSASDNVLEGQFGFAKVFGSGKNIDLDGTNLRTIVPDFLISPGVRVKFYPSCGATHCGIEAALYLRGKYNIQAADVVGIELSTHPMVPEVAFSHEPETAEQAKVSAEYCVSRALIDGQVSLDHFTTEAVMESEVQQLLRKVRYVTTKNREEKYSVATGVTIKMRDGKVYSKRIEMPKGAPENPLTPEELHWKFRDCTSLMFSTQDTEKILDLVSNLERLVDISELMQLLT